VLTSLAKRRGELDAREAKIQTEATILSATETRVDAKIAQLKSLQTQIAALLAERDAAQEKQVGALVKTYSAMKPKDAARIFDNLNDDVLLAVAQEMKSDALGARVGGDEPRRGPETHLETGQQAGAARHQRCHEPGSGRGGRGPRRNLPAAQAAAKEAPAAPAPAPAGAAPKSGG